MGNTATATANAPAPTAAPATPAAASPAISLASLFGENFVSQVKNTITNSAQLHNERIARLEEYINTSLIDDSGDLKKTLLSNIETFKASRDNDTKAILADIAKQIADAVAPLGIPLMVIETKAVRKQRAPNGTASTPATPEITAKVKAALPTDAAKAVQKADLVTATKLTPDEVIAGINSLKTTDNIGVTGKGRGTKWYFVPTKA